jgi:hypothetical protein
MYFVLYYSIHVAGVNIQAIQVLIKMVNDNFNKYNKLKQ